jgi:uncharacterized Zn finger protein (UPF0148 family)
MKCPLCGEPVSEDDLYCGNCGYNLLQNRDDWDEKVTPKVEGEVSSAEEEPTTASADVPEPSAREESIDLSLPTESHDRSSEPADVDRKRTWRVVIAVALFLLFLSCCCWITALYLFSWAQR